LQKSSKQDLLEYVKQRDAGDELNNIYVALTRTKNNLFLLLHYDKKGGLEKLLQDVSIEDSVLKNVTKTICQEFAKDLQEVALGRHLIQFGYISTEEENTHSEVVEDFDLPAFFKIDDRQDCEESELPNLQKLRTEFLQNKSVLIGNVAHEFLAHIEYLEDTELVNARNKTVSKFGSLLAMEMLDDLLQKVEKFLQTRREDFDRTKWDRVFNEHTIFDANGREFRIDRMMINTENKQIKIIDYKTGKHEEEQLQRYKRIIEQLPVVKKENYRVETEYVKISY
jgi:ATP-dependent exoDNAse (exonuclease V) beta subunit